MQIVVQAIQTQLPQLLADQLVGIYVYGSLVWGDFDPEISDIDVLVVTVADVDGQLFGQLDLFHQHLAMQFPLWQGRIELAYIAKAALQTFRTQRSPIAVISPGEPFNIKDAGIDWLINWYIIRDQSLVCYGPHPHTLIAPISQAEFRTAVRNQVGEWQDWVVHTRDSRPAQAYVILTMCRALYAWVNGTQASKLVAATWAMQQYVAQAPRICSALDWRVRYREVVVDPHATYAEAVAMVDFAVMTMHK